MWLGYFAKEGAQYKNSDYSKLSLTAFSWSSL
jgi:hypothetical protein